MGATYGGKCDTEGTVALQGVCGRDPCMPFPLLIGDERFTGLCPPTPLKQKRAPPLIVTTLRSSASRRHSPR